jgi:hypothetical protein
MISISGGGGGGSPVETLTGDTGGPVPPTANNIDIIGGSSSINNINGLLVAGNSASSTEVVTLTNRFYSSAITTTNTPTNLFTFPLDIVGASYNFTVTTAVYDRTNNKGGTYTAMFGVRTNGTTPVIIGFTTPLNSEDAELNPSSFTLNVSGNNFIVTITGIAATTISWNSLVTYVVAS